MYGSIKDDLSSRLYSRIEAGLFKGARALTTRQGAVVTAGATAKPGKEVLNFCANNYLGLAQHPAVRAAALRHLERVERGGPGQVVLFRMRAGSVAKHLGVTAVRGGSESFIHAYSGHGVIENALTAPWARRVVARFAFPERL